MERQFSIPGLESVATVYIMNMIKKIRMSLLSALVSSVTEISQGLKVYLY